MAIVRSSFPHLLLISPDPPIIPSSATHFPRSTIIPASAPHRRYSPADDSRFHRLSFESNRKTRPSRYTRYGTRLSLIPLDNNQPIEESSMGEETGTTTVADAAMDFPRGIPLGILWDREFFRTPKEGKRCPYFSKRCVDQKEAELMTEGREIHAKALLVSADYERELLGFDVQAYAIAVVQDTNPFWNLGRSVRNIHFSWYVRVGSGFPLGQYALRVEHLHFGFWSRGKLTIDSVWQGGRLNVENENPLLGIMEQVPEDEQEVVADANRQDGDDQDGQVEAELEAEADLEAEPEAAVVPPTPTPRRTTATSFWKKWSQKKGAVPDIEDVRSIPQDLSATIVEDASAMNSRELMADDIGKVTIYDRKDDTRSKTNFQAKAIKIPGSMKFWRRKEKQQAAAAAAAAVKAEKEETLNVVDDVQDMDGDTLAEPEDSPVVDGEDLEQQQQQQQQQEDEEMVPSVVPIQVPTSTPAPSHAWSNLKSQIKKTLKKHKKVRFEGDDGVGDLDGQE